MELEGLTRNMLQETLRQIKTTQSGGKYDLTEQKKYLIVVTGGEWGINHGVDFINKCVSQKILVSLVLSPSATRIMPIDQWIKETGLLQVITENSQVSVMELLKEHQEIVIPILTVNSAAKIAAGITDTLATNIIYHGLLMGKSVMSARESCDPDYLSYFVKQGNPGSQALQAKMHENQKTLAAMGVKFCQAEQLMDLLQDKQQSTATPKPDSQSTSAKLALKSAVITERDVRHLNSGTNLVINTKTIITPSAKDLAKDLGINFSRQS